MKKVTLTINDVAPGLNVLKRMHYRNYMKLLEKWTWLIRSVTNERFKGRVSIVYTRSSVIAPDYDNLGASFKPIGDALVKNGVITDDNPHVVVSFIPKWTKAKNNKDKRTIIEITEEP